MNPVTANLLFFAGGIATGYLVAVTTVLYALNAKDQELNMAARQHVSRHLALVAIAFAALVALAATIHLGSQVDWQPLWELSRTANKYLGPVVVACVLARIIPMLLDRRRWRDQRALHLLLWFTWITGATANATAAAFVTDGTPAYPAGIRFLLNLAAIGLSIWWPHPRKFTPLEEGTR